MRCRKVLLERLKTELLPDPKHIEMLRRGPEAWDAWREHDRSVIPNLAGIALKLSERGVVSSVVPAPLA